MEKNTGYDIFDMLKDNMGNFEELGKIASYMEGVGSDASYDAEKLMMDGGETYTNLLPIDASHNEAVGVVDFDGEVGPVQSPAGTGNPVAFNGQTVFLQSQTETANLMGLNGQTVFVQSQTEPAGETANLIDLNGQTVFLRSQTEPASEAANLIDLNGQTVFVQSQTETASGAANLIDLNGQTVFVQSQTEPAGETANPIDLNGQTLFVQSQTEPAGGTANPIDLNGQTVFVQSQTEPAGGAANPIDLNGQTVFVQSQTEPAGGTAKLIGFNGEIVTLDSLLNYTGRTNDDQTNGTAVNHQLDTQVVGPHHVADFGENVEEMQVVSPAEIFAEAPKKRGRKRKSDTTSSAPSRRQRPKKPKVYEIETPFEDDELERKRKNAQNAKRHRDMQKHLRETQQAQIATITLERDALKQKLKEMQQREVVLTRQLQIYRQQQQQQQVVYRVVS